MTNDPKCPMQADPKAGSAYDPAGDGAQMSFDGRMSYGDYLQIDRILDSQRLLTGAHDEMLFIIQHQTSELWLKLLAHELRAARGHMQRDEVWQCRKVLARAKQVLRLLSRGIRSKAKRKGVTYSFVFMRADGAQLGTITSLVESGAIVPVIDRVFPFEDTQGALAHVESGRAKGKVVVELP